VIFAVQVKAVGKYGTTLDHGGYAFYGLPILSSNSSGEEPKNAVILVDPIKPMQEHNERSDEPQDYHFLTTASTDLSYHTDH